MHDVSIKEKLFLNILDKAWLQIKTINALVWKCIACVVSW